MLCWTEGMVSLFKVSFCAWKKLEPSAPFVSLDLDMATLMMLPFNPSLINGKTSTETSTEEDGGGMTLMLHSQKFRLFCSSDMETCPSASWHSTVRTSLRNQFAFRVCAYYFVPLKVKLTRQMTDCHILLVSLKCIQTLKKEPSASREIAQSSGFLRKCHRQSRSDFSEQNKRKEGSTEVVLKKSQQGTLRELRQVFKEEMKTLHLLQHTHFKRIALAVLFL